jgi:hypothetical protein
LVQPSEKIKIIKLIGGVIIMANIQAIIYTGLGLNVRTEPTTTSAIITKLFNGQIVWGYNPTTPEIVEGNDGYRFTKITTHANGQIIEGYAAYDRPTTGNRYFSASNASLIQMVYDGLVQRGWDRDYLNDFFPPNDIIAYKHVSQEAKSGLDEGSIFQTNGYGVTVKTGTNVRFVDYSDDPSEVATSRNEVISEDYFVFAEKNDSYYNQNKDFAVNVNEDGTVSISGMAYCKKSDAPNVTSELDWEYQGYPLTPGWIHTGFGKCVYVNLPLNATKKEDYPIVLPI